jgi:hypothetical protein
LIKRVQLKIDFTKLAKIAYKRKQDKTNSVNLDKVSKYLISFEQQLVKVIPFHLEVKDFTTALGYAVKGGDPNNINKVIAEVLLMLKKPDQST